LLLLREDDLCHALDDASGSRTTAERCNNLPSPIILLAAPKLVDLATAIIRNRLRTLQILAPPHTTALKKLEQRFRSTTFNNNSNTRRVTARRYFSGSAEWGEPH